MKNRKNKQTLKLALISVIVVVTLGGLGWYFFLRDTKESTPTSTIGQQTKGEPKQHDDTNIESTEKNAPAKTPESESPSKKPTSTTSTSQPLQKPEGQFVNAHVLESTSNPMYSSCTTTPGASCMISFSKLDTNRQLAYQVTDAEGTTYWSWTPKKLGLSSGKWKITATAKLGDKTLTAVDPLELEIP